MSNNATKQTLLQRLDASNCDLCTEAAARIRQMQKEHNTELREASRDARDSYSEGNWDGRQEASGNGGW